MCTSASHHVSNRTVRIFLVASLVLLLVGPEPVPQPLLLLPLAVHSLELLLPLVALAPLVLLLGVELVPQLSLFVPLAVLSLELQSLQVLVPLVLLLGPEPVPQPSLLLPVPLVARN